MKENGPASKLIVALFGFYIVSCSFAAAYFNWQYATQHGFVEWLFFGEVIATAKSLAWPYFAFAPPSERTQANRSPTYNMPTGAPLNDAELERLRAVLEHLTAGELSDADIRQTRAVLQEYRARTSRALTKREYEEQFGPIRAILEYKYELGESALLSWDKGQVVTTPAVQLRVIQLSTYSSGSAAQGQQLRVRSCNDAFT